MDRLIDTQTKASAMASSVPSLHSLSANAAIKALLDESPSEVAAKVGALPSIHQNQLFLHLLDTYKGEKAKLNKLESQLDSIPSADRHVFLGPPDRLNPKSHSMADLDPEASQDTNIDSFNKMIHFRKIWRHFRSREDYVTESEVSESFVSIEAVQPVNEEKVKFRRLGVNTASDENGGELLSKTLPDLISSYLMVYRLRVAFGSLATEQSSHNHIHSWAVGLVLREEADTEGQATGGIKNKLSFYESNGCVQFNFIGTKKGADKAIELINYLIGPEWPMGACP